LSSVVGCHQEGIDIEYHLSRRLPQLEILVDYEEGQSVEPTGGVVKIVFDRDGKAVVSSFSFLERWHNNYLVINGNRTSAFKFVNVVIEQAKEKYRLPNGGITSKSIENGSKRLMDVTYMDSGK
jgi:hypothetical protein